MKTKLFEAINDQINYEIFSAHIYLNMAIKCGDLGLNGFKSWFMVQYQEELAHSQLFIEYLLDRDYCPVITNWEENPDSDFNTIQEMVELSLCHEKKVTARIINLMSICREVGDFASEHLLHWFIKEQVEEESNFNTILDDLALLKDASVFLLDRELGQRVFVPPVVA